MEVLWFKDTTIRSCLFYTSFYYNFFHNSFSGKNCVFPAGMWRVYFLVFSSFLYSWICSSQPKIMNKIISTIDRLFMAVCGPSCCGKTELIFRMLLESTFSPKFFSSFYFYQHEQPKFKSLEAKLNIQFTKFSSFHLISELENCLLVFDNSCEEIFNDKEFSKLATAGRHKNISVIYVKHNLFQQSKWSRTIDLDATHIILFKSSRDIQQIGLIGRQLNNTQFLKNSYELATKQPFGHLLIDLDPKTSDVLRYCSNIVPPGPSVFYLPPAKAVIKNLSNERARALYAAANVRDIGHKIKRTNQVGTK